MVLQVNTSLILMASLQDVRGVDSLFRKLYIWKKKKKLDAYK